MTDNPWIKVEYELPPNDGWFECTNDPTADFDSGLIGKAFYDGYGFLLLGAYRQPKWWRKPTQFSKKYGKQK